MSRADPSPEVDGDMIDGDMIDGDLIDGDLIDGDLVDEDLPEPPDRLRWISRRARAVLAIVVAAAVVAILIVQAVTAGPSTPTATVSVQPSAISAAGPPLHRTVPRAGAARPIDCPRAADGRSLCTTSTLVPAAALAAVVQHFRGATIRAKLEADPRNPGFGPTGLWYREIRARRGLAAIVVEIRRRRPADRSRGYSSEDGGRAVMLDQFVTRSLTVLVRVTTATGRLPRFDAVQELAHDPRLLAPAA